MKLFLENLNKYWATPIIAIVGGLLGLYFTVVKNSLESKTRRIETVALQIETNLKQKEFENNIKFHMFEEVKGAITKNDDKLQKAVLLLVNEMLADDSLFRDKLISILMSSPNTDESVRKIQQDIEVKTKHYIKQDELIASEEFTIDVFYLEDIIKEAEPRAKQIVDILKAEFPDYQVRLRLLPHSINAKTRYRISANEIRYEPEEKEMAQKVLDLINSKNVFKLEMPRLNEINPTKPTPNYISVYVRNM
ncbi:MAG: hypothetical protein EHM93_16925 [Bacteroidales bacterium]|nr:MAG: hypothetical protein EHM93_16925 [Bacteroidales bacterium]